MKPKHNRASRLSTVIFAGVLASATQSHAFSYFWDGNNGTANFASASGTWAAPTTGTATAGWTTNSAGTTAIAGNSITTSVTDDVNFGTDVTSRGLGGGTITVSGTVDALSIKFGNQTTSNVVLGGSGTINFGGTGSISVGAGGTTIHTISANITGGAITRPNGTLILSGTNTYSGNLSANGGTTIATQTASISGFASGGRVIFNGGTIGVRVGGAGWTTGDVDTLLANATKTSGALGIDTTNGGLTQWTAFTTANFGSTLGLTKLGAGTLILDQNNTYNGATTIGANTVAAGTLRLENAALTSASSGFSIGANRLEIASDTSFAGTALSINGGTVVSDRFTAGQPGITHSFGNLATSHATQNFIAGANVSGGNAAIQVASMTVSSGSGGSTTLNPTTANLIIVGNATGANTGTSTFNLGGTSQGNSIGGVIENGTRTTQNVTKSNSSTWTLSGDNTYNGATTISGGTLLINGNSSTATGAVNVNGGTLGGTGTIGGAITVAALATLAPGASIESLVAPTLSMASTSVFAYEVANNTSTGADLLALGGALSLTGVTLSLDLTTLAALEGGGWSIGNKLTLISYFDGIGSGITSGFNGYNDDMANTFGANQWMFDYNDTVAGGNYGTEAIAAGQNRFVTMTYIPEPSTALLGAIGLIALLRRRRA